jgi:hypothetical protein
MPSFHGPNFLLCVSAIYAFTDSDIKNINFNTQKFLSENAKATSWTILGSTTGRGKTVRAFVKTQPPIQ